MSTPKSEKKHKKKKKEEKEKQHKKSSKDKTHKHDHKKRKHDNHDTFKHDKKKIKQEVEDTTETLQQQQQQVVKEVEVIPLPSTTSKSNENNDTTTETILEMKVSKPNPQVDPIVVSFASGVPTSILAMERSANKTVRFGSNHGEKEDVNNMEEEEEDEETNEEERLKGDVPSFFYSKVEGGGRRKRGGQQKKVEGFDSTCSYTSTSSSYKKKEEEASNNQKTKLYIGIYNKQSSTLTLQPTSSSCSIHTLSQSVSSYKPLVRHGTYVSQSTTLDNLSMYERRKLLFETFGSARKKRVIKSQAENVVSVENVLGAGSGMMGAVGEQMEGGVMSESNRLAMREVEKEGEKKTNAVAAAYAEARKQFLPPFNEKTSRPSHVYDPIKMADKEAWNQISRVITKVLHSDDYNGSGGSGGNWRSALIKGRQQQQQDKVKKEDGEEENNKRSRENNTRDKWPDSISLLLDGIHPGKPGAKDNLKSILFLAHMVRFHNHVKKRTSFHGAHDEVVKYVGAYPYEVMSRFISLFMTPASSSSSSSSSRSGGYMVTKQLRDRRIVYLLILYVFASSGGEMKCGSINEFCEDLGIEVNEAGKFLSQAGFTVKKKSSGGGMMSVSLGVPLKFPPPARGGRKSG